MPRSHDFGFVESRRSRIQREDWLSHLQIRKRKVGRRGWDSDQMVDRGSVWLGWSGRVWISVDNLVAPLFAFANDGCDSAEDAFAFQRPRFVVAVQHFGARNEARLFGCYCENVNEMLLRTMPHVLIKIVEMTRGF